MMENLTLKNIKRIGIIFRIGSLTLLFGNLGLIVYSIVVTILHAYTVGITMTGITL
jgi:hypothetical protein